MNKTALTSCNQVVWLFRGLLLSSWDEEPQNWGMAMGTDVYVQERPHIGHNRPAVVRPPMSGEAYTICVVQEEHVLM